MIVFDLKCGQDHVFEAWFGSSSAYEDQRGRGLIQCPMCGDGDVGKAVMAPRLSMGAAGERSLPVASAPDSAPEMKALFGAMALMQAKMLEKSEWVVRRFADEARAIHLGESDQRSIHGQTTPSEAEALRDEGIAVAPLPFPVAPPDQLN